MLFTAAVPRDLRTPAAVCSAVLLVPVTATGSAEAVTGVGADLSIEAADAQWG
ncbi:hypothetical protein [Nocardiopsis composta]|uniref:Uncharacterized protein n=1 Tax=Nocardiopsis composta TaxID=157465 RepID=A0A7W8VH76_9ACTN|nr:hypothetical protein [Nocardiopsis composta]MBB5435895.1 hypothetical protein [Nocardiopsis composta]